MTVEKAPRARKRAAGSRERGGFLSGLVGAVVEAWDELRIHKMRVLLSLIGVGVAVCALTTVVGVGAIAQQAQIEQLERGSGRPATLMLGSPYNPETGEQVWSRPVSTFFFIPIRFWVFILPALGLVIFVINLVVLLGGGD